MFDFIYYLVKHVKRHIKPWWLGFEYVVEIEVRHEPKPKFWYGGGCYIGSCKYFNRWAWGQSTEHGLMPYVLKLGNYRTRSFFWWPRSK